VYGGKTWKLQCYNKKTVFPTHLRKGEIGKLPFDITNRAKMWICVESHRLVRARATLQSAIAWDVGRQICISSRKFCRFYVANICATTYIVKKVSDFLAVCVRAKSNGSPHETRYYRNVLSYQMYVWSSRDINKKTNNNNQLTDNAWITVVGVYVRERNLSEKCRMFFFAHTRAQTHAPPTG